MAKAWRKNNQSARRRVALENLRTSKFFEKNGRTLEEWEKNKNKQISILEKRVR